MQTLEELLLKILEEAGEEGIPQSELSRITGYSRSYITETIKRLEAKGIVRRLRIGKRSYIVKLSRYIKIPRVQSYLKLGILRASEYIYLPLFRKYLRDVGLNVRIIVYDDALTLTRDLALGEVSLALSPIYTQIVLYTVTKSLRVIAGGSLGGASLIARSNIKRLDDVNSIATSKVSTMDYLVNILLVNELKARDIKIEYISNPDDALMMLYRGIIDAINIWEPYVSLLKRHSFRELIDYNNYIGEYYCCTLGAHVSLDYRTINTIKKAYSKAINEATIHIDTLLAPYATITGLPIELIKKSIGKYKFLDYIDLSIIGKVVGKGTKFIVNIPTVLEAIHRV